MNLIDAIKSGRPFKRADGWWTEWIVMHGNINQSPMDGYAFWSEDGCLIGVTKEDFIAGDWEIQESSISITPTQFWDAYNRRCNHSHIETDYGYRVAKAIANELGLDP